MEIPTKESFWFLFLTSKCMALSSENIVFMLLILCLAWFVMAMIYWVHPGGHAWGKFYCKSISDLTVRPILSRTLQVARISYSELSSKTKARPIPGPRGAPLIGSISLMANLAHRKLAAMAESLGAKRLMAFSLGETRVIITCNPDVAKEILNGSVFADRPVKESAYSLMFNRAIGFASYGVYWRMLRKIAATHLFCPKQLSSSQARRAKFATQMVSLIATFNGDQFQVRDILKRASLNHMMHLVFGRRYELDSSSNEVEELSLLVEEGYELLGQLNWSDHLPWLAAFDLQKIRCRCSRLVPKVNQFVGRIIAEHRDQALRGQRNHDFVEVLLSLNEPDELSDPDMTAVLWEMIFRGTDTIAVLMEWILARMVLHPEIQSKVQRELDEIVGKSRQVKESDIASMVYLQAVVNEVLRLHPPGPLLSWARLAITDTIVDGHYVPSGTTAMVNMWAICRDPQIWFDPLEFFPERFITQQGDVDFSIMGSDLRLAPFGSGRRSCPGKTLGLTTVTYWVACLLQEFKWVSDDQNPVDLSEVLRLSCELSSPLIVKALPKRFMSKISK